MTQQTIDTLIGIFWLVTCLIVIFGGAFLYFRMRLRQQAGAVARLSSLSKKTDELIEKLRQDPSNEDVHRRVLDFAQQFPIMAKKIYPEILESVRATGGHTSTRNLALKVGRIQYGFTRPNGRPTIYDEQAIANDIAAHC